MFRKVLLALIVLLCVNNSYAQEIEFNQKLLPEPHLSNSAEYFGSDVAILGDYAIVGASGYNGEQGRAYVLQNIDQTWEIIAILTASDGEKQDKFGQGVEITDSYIIVSAPQNNNIGAIYIYERPVNGWVDTTETSKVIASDSEKSVGFGSSFDAYGDYIIVSASSYYNSEAACYLIKKSADGWNVTPEVLKIEPTIKSDKDYFGSSVSIYENYLAIGAVFSDIKCVDCGVTYLYKIDTNILANTTLVKELISGEQDTNKYFGTEILVRENHCYIGAYKQGNTSIIYAFKRSEEGWSTVTDTAKLTFPNNISQNSISIDYENNQLLVGCSGDKGYIFEKPLLGEWQDMNYSYSLPNFTNETYRSYTSYSLSGENIICSEQTKNEIDKSSGVVYILNKTTDKWDNAIEEQKVVSDSPFLNSSYDQFGFTMATDGDITVVGNESTNEAFVYQKSTNEWVKVATLTASDKETENGFGAKIGVDSNTIVVLASTEDAGGVYVFEKPENGWSDTTETAKLTIKQNNRSYYNVGISEDIIIASAGNNSDSSEVYMYQKPDEKWGNATETAILMHSGITYNSYFGRELAIHKDIIIASSSWDEQQVYLFKKHETGWTNMTETAKLTPSDFYEDSHFAVSIDVYNGVVAIGTITGFNTDDHVAYLYLEPESGWEDMTESIQLKPSDPIGGNDFGSPIAIFEDMVAIGATPYSDHNVYIYQKPETGWANMTESEKFTAPTNNTSKNSFGSSVNISKNNIFVGAFYDYENGLEAGAVYIYDIIAESITGVKPIDKPLFATLYPNPGTENLNIELDQSGEVNVEFYNLQGKLVKHTQFNCNTAKINVSELSNDIYIVRIIAGTESYVYTYTHLDP